MYQESTLYFSSPLPNKDLILEDVRKHFPKTKSRHSFNNFIYVEYKGIKSGIDLNPTKIIVHTDIEQFDSKKILLTMLIYLLTGGLVYFTINHLEFEFGSWSFIGVFAIVHAVILLIPSKKPVDIEVFHISLVQYLKEMYDGELKKIAPHIQEKEK